MMTCSGDIPLWNTKKKPERCENVVETSYLNVAETYLTMMRRRGCNEVARLRVLEHSQGSRADRPANIARVFVHYIDSHLHDVAC